jgi:hypothetical protein
MDYFPEYRYLFARETEKLVARQICEAYDRLVRNAYKARVRKLADLFYIWRCAYLLKKYREERPTYEGMLRKLKKSEEYRTVFGELDRIFDGWQMPREKEALMGAIEKVLGLARKLAVKR